MFCKHHYQYTQGYFFCTKCGHRKYRTRVGRRKSKKIVTISIIFVLLGGGFYLYSDEIIELSSDVPKEVEKISSSVPIPTREEIKKTIEETKKTIEESSKTVPIITTPEFDAEKIESLIYTYTNEQRNQNGLSNLVSDNKLADIARSHSVDMANRSYFSHDSPEGIDPTQRGASAGYDCRKNYGGYYTYGLAENIAQNWLYTSYMTEGIRTSYTWHTEESLAREIVDGWMNSAGHRENILTSTYDRIGIGIGISEDDAVYATQNFC